MYIHILYTLLTGHNLHNFEIFYILSKCGHRNVDFNFILLTLRKKDSEHRGSGLTDLKHTDSAWLSKVTQVNSL
jgi:hypothetical protein